MRHHLIVACALSFVVVGCSSSSDTTSTVTDSGTKADTNNSNTDTGSSTTDSASGTDTQTTTTDSGSAGDTPPGDGGTDPTCAAATTNKDCQACCRTAHMDGYNAFATALVTCACKAGNCDTDCKTTVCASSPTSPDATCNACLAKVQGTGGACVSDISAVCSDSTKPCYAFEQCIATSACNSKP